MTLKVHLQTGAFICPKCGALLKEGDDVCRGCGVKFEGVREGKKCPKCGTINDIDAVICSACGYSFGAPRERAMNDEEFLQKLLNWSKSLAEEEEKDYQEEADKVVDVFKKVTGIAIEEGEEGEAGDWERKLERNRNFLASMMEMLEEEKKAIEKKLSNARKAETKHALEEDMKVIEHEIKGLKRVFLDLEDMKKSFDTDLKRAEDEKIEKERELRREIANVRKGSIKREEELREHINSLNEEVKGLRERVGESASVGGLVENWIETEKKLEKELKKLDDRKAEEKIQEFIYSMKEETKMIMSAVKMRAEEENELKHLLKVLDDLLESLPKKKIKEFSKSEDFALYERVLDRYHVGE